MHAIARALVTLLVTITAAHGASISAATLTGVVEWTASSTWIGGQVPGTGDSVVIGSATSGCDAFTVQVSSSVTVASLVVNAVTAGCHGVVRIKTGVTLTVTGAMTLKGALELEATTSVLQTGAMTQESNGLIQGTGKVDATSLTLSGRIAPGKTKTSCVACQNTYNPASSSTGTLTFAKATTLNGASIFVKALSTGNFDRVTFVSTLNFAGALTNVYTDVDASTTGTCSFISAGAITPASFGSFYQVSARIAPYPWQSECMATNCPISSGGCGGGGGGGGVALRSVVCFSTADTGGGTTSIDSGTSGTTSSFCPGSDGGSISVTIGTCSSGGGGSTPTCNPACVHGTCTSSGVCQCAFDSSGNFGWTGTACDAPSCATDCGGAAYGTCSSGATFPSCSCIAPHSGTLCESLTCTPACQNGGTCTLGGGGATLCNCATGFAGTDCSTVVAAGTCPPDCGHGTCSASFTCQCATGWSGTACNIPVCPGYVENASPNCNGNGVCSSDATPVCTCSAGWSGADCGARECVANYCQNGGTCTASGSSLTCTCTSGWGGSTCSLRTASAGGMAPWLIGVIVVGAVIGGALLAVGIALLTRWQRNKATKLFAEKAHQRVKEMAAETQ